MRLTADTIDDDDIRGLRRVALHRMEHIIALTCTIALGQDPHATAADRVLARGRCAEVINERRKS